MSDPFEIITKNANLIYSILIIAGIAYTGVTVFARWIAAKFLDKFDKRIQDHKTQIDASVKKQEDFLYDTSTKFDVSITKLSTEFAAVGKTVSNVESEVRDIKHDVHDIGNKVNDHLVKSAIKWTELDNKLVHHDNKFDNLQDKFSNFMNRNEREIKER